MSKSKPTSGSKLQMDLEQIVKAGGVLRALNHATRQKILNLLHANTEMNVTDIYKRLKMEQSLTSSFLGLLRKAGAVKTRREGQTIYYSVNYQRLSEIEKGAKIING